MEYKPRPSVAGSIAIASAMFLLGIWIAIRTDGDWTVPICFIAGAFWLVLSIIELLAYIADVLRTILRKMK